MSHDVLASDSLLSKKYLTCTAKTIETILSILYNSMLAPIIPFAIKGFIRYQGESNVEDDDIYARANKLMLKDFRQEWGSRFAFYAVQRIPKIYSSYPCDNDYKRANFRVSQSKILSEPKTGIMVASDSLLDKQELLNSHPRNKKDVGFRLALWALARDYGLPINYTGPIYNGYKVKGNKIIFDVTSPKRGYYALSVKDAKTILKEKIIVNEVFIDRANTFNRVLLYLFRIIHQLFNAFYSTILMI